MSNVIFIGDSYCASYQHRRGRLSKEYQPLVQNLTYIDHVADTLALEVYNYGFSGQSWYYSRRKFIDDITKNSAILNDADLVVFCHTNSGRFNTTNGKLGTQALPNIVNNFKHTIEYSVEDLEISKALGMWQAYLVDHDFQNWAQYRWFEEIGEIFQDKKTVHLNCFPREGEALDKFCTLPGMIYTTPLICITLGESTGTDQEVEAQGAYGDFRPNHLNNYNNLVLSQIIIDSYQNYKPGIYNLPLEKFELINPNSTKWPKPGFGTR